MTGYDGHALAPLSRRGLAWIFDSAVGVGLAACLVSQAGGGDLGTLWHLLAFKSLNGTAGRQLSAATHPGQLSMLGPILGLLAILTVITIVSVAYRVVTTALWGFGIGKAVFGLKIVADVPSAAGPVVPGWRRSWKRWAVPQAPGLIPLPATGLLAYLPALRDSRRRGLHDRAAGTVVVDIHAPLRHGDVDWTQREPVEFFAATVPSTIPSNTSPPTGMQALAEQRR